MLTGIKVIDLIEPYSKGGKIGLFGGAGVGKTVLIMELINNIAKNFRDAYGLGYEEFVDIHTYNPDQLDIGMFSADELLNNGSNYASWYGYDHQGNMLDGVQPGMNEFLTDQDADGNYKREIGAFQPIYVAGYIQDKFALDDIIFNIGVRVDRYDANQGVLKDRYSL